MIVVTLSALVGEDWTSGFLLEVGVSVLLVVPLVILQNRIQQSIGDIQRTQEKTEVRVTELGEEVASTQRLIQETRREFVEQLSVGLDSENNRALAEIDRVADAPTRESVTEALQRAEVAGLTHPRLGLRIPVAPGCFVKFQLKPPSGRLSISLEDRKSRRLSVIAWTDQRNAADLLVVIAAEMKRLQVYPGNEIFKKNEPFANLSSVLKACYRQSQIGGDSSYLEVVEFCPQGGWILTPTATICVLHDYHIELNRLDEIDWVRHLYGKNWGDDDVVNGFMSVKASAKALGLAS